MNRQRFLLPALWVLTLVRMAMLPLRELSPVEAYGVMCSERLDVWHPMLGPVLPVLVRITTAIFGLNEWGVRFASPLLMLLATVLLWRLARGLFDANTASWSIVIFSVLPAVNIAAVTMTPMTLSITGSVVLLHVLRVALHRSHPYHLPWWSVGLTTLGLMATDWHLSAFIFSAAAALAVTRRGRSAVLKWPVIPVLAGCIGLGCTVLFAWASEHNWMPFNTVAEPVPNFMSELWQAMLIHSPVMIAALTWGLAFSVLRKSIGYPVAYLYAFASPLLTVDVLTFLSSPWPMSGFGGWIAPAVILLANRLAFWTPRPLQLKAWFRTTAIMLALVQTCIVLDTDLVRRAGRVWKLSRQEKGAVSLLPTDPSQNLVGWKLLAGQVKTSLEDLASETGILPYVVADRWQLAAPLSFYLRDAHAAQPTSRHPLVHSLHEEGSPHPFAQWPGPVDLQGPVLFITDDPECTAPPASLLETHPNQRLKAWFDVTHQGLLVRTVKVFACSAEITGKK